MNVSAQMGLELHLQQVFETNQKSKIIESMNIVSDQLKALSSHAYLDMLVKIKQKVDEANSKYELKNEELARRVEQLETKTK
jgi:hypothetical protein